ncbi:hypothetical protein [Nocardioides antri]|uniref:Uncharacterized protein n=1 Tax=Nocardioides antri TaxID=2607659 RepID=A0A5B1M0V8_9ACTN|nr:hypothetical protein [Nocardioides antri]KAA1426296.1 hypothetical protein F0U47_15470 [Nocardioides antri]
MTDAASGRLRRRLRRRNDRHGAHQATWQNGATMAAPQTPIDGPEAPSVLPSNLGPEFDARVAEALRRQLPAGIDPDYDLVRDNFDVAHYLLQAPAVLANPEIDPVRHFLRQGRAAKLTPDPNFSTDSYLKRHPERRDDERNPYATWLAEGRAAGEIAEPVMGIEKLAKVLGTTADEVAEQLAERRSDVHRRLHHGKLGEMFAKAAEVEPLVGDLWPEIARPRMMPIPWLVVADQLGALHASQEAVGFARARVVLVVDDPADGLVRRLLDGLTALLAPHDVVVVTTASGSVPEGVTPAGVRRVDFAETAHGLGPMMTQQVLVELLRSLCADAIVGVDSRLFLESLTPYGRALSASERVFLGFAGLRRTVLGHEAGPSARYFYRHVELVEGVLVEQPATAARLVDDYRLPDDIAAKVRAVGDDGTLAETVRELLREAPDGDA